MTEAATPSAAEGPELPGEQARRTRGGAGPWLTVCLLAILIMLPRLASPQFGLLDDGNSLRAARLLAAGHWQLGDVAVGRSRPLYWLFWSVPYLIAGPSPLAYFVANLLSLLVLLTCVFMVCRALKMSLFSTWLAAVVFLLAGPVVENFYTLSKGEPLQLILILIALHAALRGSTSTLSRRPLWPWLTVAILSFLAGITKETALVMIPISVAWWGAAKLDRSTNRRVDEAASRTALIGFTVGATFFLIYRAATVGTALFGSGYTSAFEFSIARVLDSGSRWLAWLLRDFSFLLPLAVMPLFWWRLHLKPSRIDIIAGAMIWMAGWLIVFLPWLFVTEYYLLPFSLGAAFLAAVLVGDAVAIVRRKTQASVVTLVLLGLAGALFCMNMFNFSTVARIQLAVDEENASVIRFLALDVPQGGKVVVNIQEPSEYVSQIGLHLAEFYDRADIRVAPLEVSALSELDQSYGLFVVSPYIENQVLLSDRLGVYEPKVRIWIESIAEFVRVHGEDVYGDRRQVHGLSFDPARAVCPLFAGDVPRSLPAGLPVPSIMRYCQGGTLIDRRVFTYGWDVYRLARP
jgi:hypothetical protein